MIPRIRTDRRPGARGRPPEPLSVAGFEVQPPRRPRDVPDVRRDSRGGQARALVPGLAALLGLAGCAMAPQPLTPDETALRVDTDLTALAANQPRLDGPLTLHGAMARALAHNLEARVQAMEQALSLHQLELARLRLLPGLTGRYGIETRSNVQASISRSIPPRPSRPTPSTSNDRTRRSGNLTATWHVLDFGVSWFGAKQQSDRALIAHERRRKAVHEVVAEVRRAWWRAVAGERSLARVEPLMDRVRQALADSERLATRGMEAPVAALQYQRALLTAIDEIERQRRETRLAKIDLAALIGLAPGADYALALPAADPEPRPLTVDSDELAALALAHRPELREGQLSARIAADEVKRAMLRLLPGLQLSAGVHQDSNSFLVNGDWLALGAAVSANLTELFTGPAAIAAARAGRDLAQAQREALSMAVLSQLYIAVAAFEEARARHATAGRIAEIEQRIVAVLRSSGEVGVVDRLRTISGEIDALRALLARDLSLAEVEDSFGRIFLAVGADVLPHGQAATLDEVAAAIAATEAAWSRGEIAMVPWRSPEVPDDGES